MFLDLIRQCTVGALLHIVLHGVYHQTFFTMPNVVNVCVDYFTTGVDSVPC